MTNEEALGHLGIDTNEQASFGAYRAARRAYDDAPSHSTATEVLRWAQKLVDISDDYQGLLDEADDIMAEPV
jgi:hypothetical protein